MLTHCRDLASRDYYAGRVTPQFIVLFLPYESLLSDALTSEPLLLEKAFSSNIVLATPTTMLALLRTIGHGWSQQTLAENARRIQELGKEMLERLAKLAEHIANVGKGLQQSTKAYNDFIGSLDDRVLVTARRMQELGVRADRSLEAPQPIPGQVRSSRALPSADSAQDSDNSDSPA